MAQDAVVQAQAARIRDLEKKLNNETDPLIFPIAWRLADALKIGQDNDGNKMVHGGSNAAEILTDFIEWLEICDPERKKGQELGEHADKNLDLTPTKLLPR